MSKNNYVFQEAQENEFISCPSGNQSVLKEQKLALSMHPNVFKYWTTTAIDAPFETNGKLIVLSVSIHKHILAYFTIVLPQNLRQGLS